MHVRTYRPQDLPALLALFYAAVHTGCAADYTPAQLDAWAPAEPDTAAWAAALSKGTALVAEEAGQPLGFGAIGPDGYLDLLFVRPDRQGQGVGSVLCGFLEGLYPAGHVTVHASRTARPFFRRRGYQLVRTQQVARRGQTLTNHVMEKELI